MLARRKLLIGGAASLCMPAIVRAQSPGEAFFRGESNANVGGPLLDQLSATAAVAYSLRKLKAAYAGKCLQIQRSSDSTNQDIGFVNGFLDTASAITFCAGSVGTVNIWYDQSGNARNATPHSGQMQVIVSGSQFNFSPAAGLSNGLCINGNTGNLSNTFVNSSPSTIVVVAQMLACDGGLFDSVGTGNLVSCTNAPPMEWVLWDQTNFLTATTWDTNLHGFQSNINGASSSLYVDEAALITGTQASVPGSGQVIGGRNAFTGHLKMSEFITFTSALSQSDRSICQTNWRAVYGTP